MARLDFVAVDFETANGKRESACAVGVAVARDGEIAFSDSWLIKPPSSAAGFNPMNVALHGVTEEDCAARGISWVETAQRLKEVCAGLPLVAHNASFDRSVWEAANRAAGVTDPLPPFHCTLNLSRGHLDLVDHKLPTVARHLGLDDFPHHQAEADAVAAARITLVLARRTGATTVEELWERTPRRSGTGSTTARTADSKRVPESMFRTRVDRPSAGPSLADPTVPAPTTLDGEVVVITGELALGTREEVQERLRQAGATVVKSPTKKLTCLVIGAGPEVRNPPLTGATGKEKVAIQRIREGQHIAVIGEPELRELLERAESGSTTDVDADLPAVLYETLVTPPQIAPIERPLEARRSLVVDESGVQHETPAEPPTPVTEEGSVLAPLAPQSPGLPTPPRPIVPPRPPQRVYSAFPPEPSATGPMPSTKPANRWVFHAVMWSVIALLTVGMLVVGMLLSPAGVSESTWAPVVGISWLLAPVVFTAWLVVTIVRAVRSRRRGRAAPQKLPQADGSAPFDQLPVQAHWPHDHPAMRRSRPALLGADHHPGR